MNRRGEPHPIIDNIPAGTTEELVPAELRQPKAGTCDRTKAGLPDRATTGCHLTNNRLAVLPWGLVLSLAQDEGCNGIVRARALYASLRQSPTPGYDSMVTPERIWGALQSQPSID
jgi:hypothetical protein